MIFFLYLPPPIINGASASISGPSEKHTDRIESKEIRVHQNQGGETDNGDFILWWRVW